MDSVSGLIKVLLKLQSVHTHTIKCVLVSAYINVQLGGHIGDLTVKVSFGTQG